MVVQKLKKESKVKFGILLARHKLDAYLGLLLYRDGTLSFMSWIGDSCI